MIKFITRIKRNISDMFRPVLSDKHIMKLNQRGLLIENPISFSQLQPNSVDLTLSDSWKTLEPNITESPHISGIIDSRNPIKYEHGSFIEAENGESYFIIKPKQFVLMASNEILHIPNGIIAFVQGRSSIARLAIQTEQAGLIDAGFRGTITFEVFNQSEYPIILYKGTRVAQVYFFKAQYALSIYGSNGKGSKYQQQIEATGSKIHLDIENYK